MTFCLSQTITWSAKIDLLDVADVYVPFYPIKFLIKDGLTLNILITNVYGCFSDTIISLIVSLDFNKAFDRNNLNILITKLMDMGLS